MDEIFFSTPHLALSLRSSLPSAQELVCPSVGALCHRELRLVPRVSLHAQALRSKFLYTVGVGACESPHALPSHSSRAERGLEVRLSILLRLDVGLVAAC